MSEIEVPCGTQTVKWNDLHVAINNFLLTDSIHVTDDKLPVMLALLELYGEFGEYSNYVDGFELNGNGSIDWDRTIGTHLPILSNGQPIYTEYETRKAFRDDSDYIARPHRAVLSECSQAFRDAGVDKYVDASSK